MLAPLQNLLQPLAERLVPLVYLVRLDFSTTDAAPLVDPYPDVIGALDTFADAGNKQSASGGKLLIAGPQALNDPRSYAQKDGGSTSFTRQTGMALFFAHNRLSGSSTIDIGWSTNTAVRPVEHALFVGGTTCQARLLGGSSADLSFTLSASTDYSFALILRSSGYFIFVKGGGASNWRLLFVSSGGNTSSLSVGLGSNGGGSGSVQFDDYRVIDQLPYPFNADYGIAIVNDTNFTQSLSSELLTNGDFSSWSGGNPTSWTITETLPDNEVKENPSGSAEFTSTATTNRPVAGQSNILTPVDSVYEIAIAITALTGSFRVQVGNNAIVSYTSGARTRYLLTRSFSNATFQVFGGTTLPLDVTVDSISVKRLILNAQQTTVADGIFDFEFTLPGSPQAGQTIELRYRIVDTTNYWVASIVRNDANTNWDFKVDSIASNTTTNRISVTSIGTTKRIQVRTIGDLHNFYTFDTSEVPTKRGGELNVATHNTATEFNTVYNSAIIPVRRTVYKVEDTSTYDPLLNRAVT